MTIPDDILVIVFEDGERQCCTLEEWQEANLEGEDTAQQIVRLIAGENLDFGGGAQPAGRMWLESGEVDRIFPDESGPEKFYVC